MSETSAGTAATYDSRAAVLLVHVGDGLILGAVLYLTTGIVLHLTSGYFARTVSDHSGVVGFLVFAMLVLVVRYGAAASLRSRDYQPKVQGWKAKRDLRWVGATGLLGAIVLFGVTVSLGGLRALSTLVLPLFFVVPVMVLGLFVRIAGEHAI